MSRRRSMIRMSRALQLGSGLGVCVPPAPCRGITARRAGPHLSLRPERGSCPSTTRTCPVMHAEPKSGTVLCANDSIILADDNDMG
eukprot:29333-Eustigmatos_ZCMA.PRE.1